jgi:anti-anti-sigma regulatory factor
MSLSIVALQPRVVRIALEGNLDVFTSELLRPELAGVTRRRPAQVEVDLSRLRSVHTRGVEVLLPFLADLARAGCRMTLVGLQAQPLECFKAALVDAILNATPLVN